MVEDKVVERNSLRAFETQIVLKALRFNLKIIFNNEKKKKSFQDLQALSLPLFIICTSYEQLFRKKQFNYCMSTTSAVVVTFLKHMKIV